VAVEAGADLRSGEEIGGGESMQGWRELRKNPWLSASEWFLCLRHCLIVKVYVVYIYEFLTFYVAPSCFLKYEKIRIFRCERTVLFLNFVQIIIQYRT
jgi:hypothetical protein